MPTTDPCKVCGCTDMQLMDGFYYCLECGTQDVNVRETLIEYHQTEDGTRAHLHSKKIFVLDSKIDPNSMSLQWHKWHTYNFVLIGLADELIELGAKPSFKMKLLWIWTEYVRKFRKTVDEVDKSQHEVGGKIMNLGQTSFFNMDESDDLREGSNQNSDENILSNHGYDMSICTLATLVAMLYVALNLDESEIQLGDLCRFIRESRLSVRDFMKFVPKELKCRAIDHWDSFVLSKHKIKSPKHIRKMAMKLFKILNLGLPCCPNMQMLMNRYLVELNMPSEFEALVFSLARYVPINLCLDQLDHLNHIPDYEGFAMAYIVMAFKISFGLDDSYEFDLSDAITKINMKHGYERCYKSSMFTSITSRFFSFKDWSKFIEYRSFILSKYFLPLAIIRDMDNVSDDVFVSSTKERLKPFESSKNLSDDIIMELLNKLFVKLDLKDSTTIFPPSLTPMTTYSDMILSNLNDEDIRDHLSEDFSGYSLKYITIDFKLECDLHNVFTGVSHSNKKIVKKLSSKCLMKPLSIDRKKVIVVDTSNEESGTGRVKHVTVTQDSDVLVAELEVEKLPENHDDNSSTTGTFASSFNLYDEKFEVEDEILSGAVSINEQGQTSTLLRIEDTIPQEEHQLESTHVESQDEPSKTDAIDLLLRIADSRFSILNVTFPLTRKRAPNTEPRFNDGLISSLMKPKIMRRKTLQVPSDDLAVNENLDESIKEYFNKILHVMRSESTTADREVYADMDTASEINETFGEPTGRDDTLQATFDSTIAATDPISHEETNATAADTVTMTVDVPLQILSENDEERRPIVRKESHIIQDPPHTVQLSNVILTEPPDELPAIPHYGPLLEDADSISTYSYWMRHYTWELKTNCPNVFETELNENFPKSFSWLLRICASMIETNTISLYNNLTYLEKILKNNVHHMD